MFLKNKNIIFKIRRSKVTDYAALIATSYKLFVSVFSIHINLVSVTALGKTVILTGGEDDDAG